MLINYLSKNTRRGHLSRKLLKILLRGIFRIIGIRCMFRGALDNMDSLL